MAELTSQEQPKMGKRWCPRLLPISPSSPTSCTQHFPSEGMVATSSRGEPEKMLLLALFFSCCSLTLWAIAIVLVRSVHVEGWALRHAEWCKERFLPNFRHLGVLSLSSQKMKWDCLGITATTLTPSPTVSADWCNISSVIFLENSDFFVCVSYYFGLYPKKQKWTAIFISTHWANSFLLSPGVLLNNIFIIVAGSKKLQTKEANPKIKNIKTVFSSSEAKSEWNLRKCHFSLLSCLHHGRKISL